MMATVDIILNHHMIGWSHAEYYAALNEHRLIRSFVCQDCGINSFETGRLMQGHHTDYAKPLDVVWLCGSCHSRRHTARLIILKKYKRMIKAQTGRYLNSIGEFEAQELALNMGDPFVCNRYPPTGQHAPRYLFDISFD
jgi:hypothetical protein